MLSKVLPQRLFNTTLQVIIFRPRKANNCHQVLEIYNDKQNK